MTTVSTSPSVDLRVSSHGGVMVDGGIRVVTDLRRHIPRIALEWDDDAPGRSWQQVDATMVFADISGFTALTEKLARRGRIGAEELIETLNRIFGGMLGQAALRGGELLKFGGDALLFAFRGEGHPERACAAAVDMRLALREAAKIPTSVGRLKLSMSVGVHSGPVDFFLVGAPTRELLVLGPAATATAEAEHAAVAGEILVTAGTARRLPSSATRAREDDDLHVLRWRAAPTPPGEAADMPVVTDEQLRSLFPNALGEYLADRVPDPEHKVATIAFARFSGTDSMLAGPGHDAVAEALHGTISVFEEALIAEGCTLLATDLDSDGGKLFMGSGVPFSSEDDEGRMLRAMRHVLDVGTPLPLQIGVNRGHVFAAEVGALYRSAYSAMGDTTNTAARIMSKAGPGVLFAHPTVLEQSRTLFATQPAGPFPMKGKAIPVLVHEVGEELGTREAQTRSLLPLVGRDEEVALVRSALERALSGEGGVITVTAATGLGKSRIISEAMRGIEATVVHVRAEPYGMASPYRMLRDQVRQAFRVERADPAEMAEQLLATFTARMPDMLPMAPLLSDVVNVPIPPTAESSAIEPRFRPDRIADLVLRVVDVSVRGPFVLMVEEAHWADASSIQVLRRLADATEGRAWAVVVARRPDGAGLDPEGGTRVLLEPLSDEFVRRIVIGATEDMPLREHEIDGIVARAGGNPLYVEELVRVFREVGSLEAMPESLHAALDAQIDALDPHSRRVLRYASVLGRSFRREVLDETLRGDDLVVDEATVSKLGEFLEPDGQTRLRFRTGMVRDAAYDGLAYRLRAKLHAAAGRAVEALSTDLEADADTLSLHFSRGGDYRSTWRFARMAGDRAARAYANVDAATQYDRALDAARHVGGISDEERYDLWIRLGEVRDTAGLFGAAIDAFSNALELARGEPLAACEALRKRARTKMNIGGFSGALRDVTRGLRLLEGDDSFEARLSRLRLLSARLAVRSEQQRLADVVAGAHDLIERAREMDDPETLEQALLNLEGSAFQLGDTAVGAGTREAMLSAERHGRLGRAATAAANLGAFAFYTGDWDAAVEGFTSARTLAAKSGDLASAALQGLSLGELFVNRGQLERGQEALVDSIRDLRALGMHASAAYGVIHLARIDLERGEAAAAEQRAAAAEAELLEMAMPIYALEATLVRAEALSASGRATEARAMLDEAIEGRGTEHVALLPRVHLERARALLAEDDLAGASAEIESGQELARRYTLAYEEARLLQLRVELENRRGDEDAARAAGDEARELVRRLGIAAG